MSAALYSEEASASAGLLVKVIDAIRIAQLARPALAERRRVALAHDE